MKALAYILIVSYKFAPSSSITISEFLKFSLSTIFFYHEYRKRITFAGGTYQSLALSSSEHDENAEDEDKLFQQDAKTTAHSIGFNDFWKCCWDETSPGLKYGFAQLALFYALINNTVGSKALSTVGCDVANEWRIDICSLQASRSWNYPAHQVRRDLSDRSCTVLLHGYSTLR